ncbi:MAG: hypothetical protein A2511_15865 [Deltaproteobacteria bacterium RIFOXYD12_FULL_50_9]|nr:MAG: hypothetical protein A2511_15865 [Deltaproteobacteria bacterium RIFOXYD12_FULL_50_9]
MRKHVKLAIFTGLSLVLATSSFAFAVDQALYQKAKDHKGGDVSPLQAVEMVKKDTAHTFLVDIRTQYEYQDLGHPNVAYNIPYKFYTNKADEKGYKSVVNGNFCQELKARFNPANDTLILFCRSGHRSIDGTTAAVDCGFQKSFNMMGGFEGDKVKDKNSPDFGKRVQNGWRAEKLDWTYDMDKNLMYQPDLK